MTLRRLVANRPLTGLVLANGISSVGDWLYLTALPILVLRETGDVALVGVVAAARLLPWLLLSLPAGVVADRFSRHKVLLGAESLRTALMLLMTVLCFVDGPLWAVLALALGSVAAGTFALPAQCGLVPELARDDAELGIGNAVSAGLDNIACVVGPAITAVLVLAGGLEIAFAINGLSFVAVVGLLVWLVGRPALARPDGARPAVQAAAPASSSVDPRWRDIARAAARPLTLDAGISFAGGALSVLPVVVVVHLLAADPALVGVLGAAAGLGGIGGAAAAAAFVNGRTDWGIAAGVLVTAGSFALLPVGGLAVVCGAGVCMAAGGLVLLDALNTTTIQRSTPNEQVGRTFGLLNTLASGWVMAGSLVPPILAGVLGAQAAVLLPAVGMLMLGVASLVPAIRASRRGLTLAAAVEPA